MKIINIVLRIVLGLLLISPILGVLGVFPPPTPDLYNTQQAYNFIEMLFTVKYIMYIQALVFAVSIVLIIMNRMALASLLILPITVNIISFHAFLDGGLLTAGAIMGNILFVLNLYFLWENRHAYKVLLNKPGSVQ